MSVPMYCIVKRNTNITLELEKQFFNFKGWIASSELEKEMFSIQDFLYVLVPYIRRTNLHFGIIFCSDYLLLLSSGKKKKVRLKSTIIELSCQTHCIQTTARLPPLTVIWLRIYPLCWDLCTGNGAQNYSKNLPKFWKHKLFKSKCLNAICRQ